MTSERPTGKSEGMVTRYAATPRPKDRRWKRRCVGVKESSTEAQHPTSLHSLRVADPPFGAAGTAGGFAPGCATSGDVSELRFGQRPDMA